MKTTKKLIEVALPLVAINKASVRESFIYRGNPSAIHKWWAQRPLAAARAVIFAQMVDDPSAYVDVLRADPKLRRKAESALKARLKLWEQARTLVTKARGTTLSVPEPGPAPTLDDILADEERQRLFRIIEELVKWESTTNESVLQAARDEIWQSWRRACAENADYPRAKELFDRHKLPAFLDPFAGGGTLPLEAQRLGLESYASDLNPVAVLINKAIIEIPLKFAGQPPVNPKARKEKTLLAQQWRGPQGLAEDVRYYGQWMRDEAANRIGNLYPEIEVTAEMANRRPDLKALVGRKLTVIAWLWARTVKSPNPAFAHVDVPLASTFMLSTKAGKETYVQPVVEGNGYRFTVKVGKPKDAEGAKNGTKLARGANFKCLMSGTPMSGDHVKAEGKAGRMGTRLMAIVAVSDRGRVYLSPTPEHEAATRKAKPDWRPEVTISGTTQYLGVKPYGIDRFDQVFTNRQLVALTTFSDLVQEARERVKRDALAISPYDNGGLDDNGTGATAYAQAVAMYLAFSMSKTADYNCSLVPWYTKEDRPGHLFSKQAIPMVWDYAELNPFSQIGGGVSASVEIVAGALNGCNSKGVPGHVRQLDAVSIPRAAPSVISTDPPYYDNVPYADLSDFFYVWLRRSLRSVFPDLFATLAVPKSEELVAFAYRHDEGRRGAEEFFLNGMTRAMHRLAEQAHPAFPVTIYYAFKQAEGDGVDGIASTGWDTFLGAVIQAGFAIGGTWPMRTERSARSRGIGSNALASSIVLVCRKRAADAPTASRREFVTALKTELPVALAHLQRGNIAPVDLAQAAIGPGMAVYTRFGKVLGAEGKELKVREALALINQTLDEALAEQEGDFDADSRWALTWFEQSGFAEGEYGVAEQLSKSKNTSVAGMVEANILESKRGKVRLLKPSELPADWDPTTDPRLTAWETVHHLIHALEGGGESAAASLVAKLGAKAEVARELCYRLYTLSERKKRAAEALSYNGLVQSWPEITRLALEGSAPMASTTGDMFEKGQ